MIDCVIVVGGNGALGQAVIKAANEKKIKTICIDLSSNPEAQVNLMAGHEAETYISADIPSDVLVVCTAGSWRGGEAKDAKLSDLDALYSTNLRPSLFTCSLSGLLKSKGTSHRTTDY